MALEQELKKYQSELPRLLSEHAGKYVVIHGDRIIGIFADYGDALKAGYDACKLSQFLVKRIEAVETIHYFTRNFVCPT